jgi:arginine N-succinyltransferase
MARKPTRSKRSALGVGVRYDPSQKPMLEDFEIRAATREHLASICELARHLNSVNLPNDPRVIDALLTDSERSFTRQIADPQKREYIFVLWDRVEQRVAGTSMVIGQLGRRDAPYIYFDVREEEKYSATLDRHFIHRILATIYSYDGPTEIGGLVVHPDYRRRTERLGTLISYVRFLFIAMRRKDFRDELLAELLPPLEPDGTSHLWDAVGRRFTGLTYREADHLSKQNKEFIKGLFPDEVHATLLSEQAQAVLGKVGPETVGVQKMLSRIGFRYADRVDPFDGGPHFTAPTDEVTLIRGVQQVAGVEITPAAGATALFGREVPAAPYFVAVVGELGAEKALLSPEVAPRFDWSEGPIFGLRILDPGRQ